MVSVGVAVGGASLFDSIMFEIGRGVALVNLTHLSSSSSCSILSTNNSSSLDSNLLMEGRGD